MLESIFPVTNKLTLAKRPQAYWPEQVSAVWMRESKECVYETFNKAHREDNRLAWKLCFQGELIGSSMASKRSLPSARSWIFLRRITSLVKKIIAAEKTSLAITISSQTTFPSSSLKTPKAEFSLIRISRFHLLSVVRLPWLYCCLWFRFGWFHEVWKEFTMSSPRKTALNLTSFKMSMRTGSELFFSPLKIRLFLCP